MEENLKELINKFMSSIPNNTEDRSELIEEFKKFLNDFMNQLINLRGEHNITNNQIKEIVTSQANTIIDLNTNEKRAYLIEDKYFQQLRECSEGIFEDAINKVEGKKGKTKEEYNALKNKMKLMRDSVKYFNMQEANELYSQTLLDIDFLCGKDIASLRLGAYIENNRKDEER